MNALSAQESSLRNIMLRLKSKVNIKYNIINVLRLTEALLERETLDLYAIKEILGERPFEPRSNYKSYLETKSKMKEEEEEKKKEDSNHGKAAETNSKTNADEIISARSN